MPVAQPAAAVVSTTPAKSGMQALRNRKINAERMPRALASFLDQIEKKQA
jgi:hypothetical protein